MSENIRYLVAINVIGTLAAIVGTLLGVFPMNWILAIYIVASIYIACTTQNESLSALGIVSSVLVILGWLAIFTKIYK